MTLVCQAPPEVSVNLVVDPGQGPPGDASHPKFEMEVTVTPEFNDDPANTATIHCTVRDSFGATGSADIIITVN